MSICSTISRDNKLLYNYEVNSVFEPKYILFCCYVLLNHGACPTRDLVALPAVADASNRQALLG